MPDVLPNQAACCSRVCCIPRDVCRRRGVWWLEKKDDEAELLREIREKRGWKACLLVRDVVDCVVSGEGIPVHLKTNGDFVILRRKFSCQ